MDKYGYYQIGDLKTYSVYQMMDYHHKHPQPYKWIYNDDFFSQYDWTQEPVESLDQLYKNRAKEVREQYDYVVLYYSGGYDSANMLHAFLDNGITFYSRHDTVSHQYHERTQFTEKKLEKIEKQYPTIKIRRIDYADIICSWPQIVKDANLNLDPIHLFGPRMSVNRLALDVMYEHIDDWKQLLKDKKTICTLQGVDSVQPSYIDKENKWVHNFFDVHVCGHLTPMRQMTNKSNRDTLEFFYWAPTDAAAKILIKQGHLAKKFLINKKIFTNKIDRIVKNFNVFGYEPFKKLIYPRIFEGDERFYNKKELTTFWGNRDQWFFNSELPGSKEHRETIYLPLFREDRSHWKTWFHNNDINQGFKKIKSIDYTI
jgi:hypothetical protein